MQVTGNVKVDMDHVRLAIAKYVSEEYSIKVAPTAVIIYPDPSEYPGSCGFSVSANIDITEHVRVKSVIECAR